MAKRASIGLTNYVTRILIMAFGGTILIGLGTLFTFLMLLQVHLIAPASSGETAARNTMEHLMKEGEFSLTFDTTYFDYIFFNEEGEILSSSLKEKELPIVKKRFKNRNAKYSTGAFLEFSDGTYSLFIWQYQAFFTNSWLREYFPKPEFLFIGSTLLLFVLYSIFVIRFASKHLSSKISLINQASLQVKQQNLDSPIQTRSGIKEFDCSLSSMEEMRQALKESLVQQWQVQQQQKQELAALSHDIKTPLTIISGNAELLLEEHLTASQETFTRAIFKSSKRSQQYLQVLQQVTNFELRPKEKSEFLLEELIKEIAESLTPLANQKGLSIAYSFPKEVTLWANRFNLMRVLLTIGENALAHSTVGEVKLSVTKEEQVIMFIFEDTGPGFSKEGLKHATEMFWQQDSSRSTPTNYGIGLALANRIAKDHGGTLLLENQAKGAKVTLIVKNETLDD